MANKNSKIYQRHVQKSQKFIKCVNYIRFIYDLHIGAGPEFTLFFFVYVFRPHRLVSYVELCGRARKRYPDPVHTGTS